MILPRKLRMGMVGGGINAFIGGVHRAAARLDGHIDLVAGAFSSDPDNARRSAAELHVAPERAYADHQQMAEAEAALPPSRRIDFVSIVTPNHLHFPVASTFLRAGIPVVCDKPMTISLDEALQLRDLVRQSGLLFALTHNYSGYPMVKQARQMVRDGELGRILKVTTEYPQGWLLNPIDADGQKQAAWRTNPAMAGASGCVGDIGTHAEHLARYITGLAIDSLCADFQTHVPGRRLEDDASMLLRYKGGARGVLHASQVSAGEENGLNIRVHGEKSSLEWQQEHPNELIQKFPDQPQRILRRGNDYLGDEAKRFTRLPFGHPEAFIEAFANIYLEVARALGDQIAGVPPTPYDLPTVDDGVTGLAFIETAVASARSDTKWIRMPETD